MRDLEGKKAMGKNGRRTKSVLALILLCSTMCFEVASAYYLPGTYPQEFRVGDRLQGWLPHLGGFEKSCCRSSF